MIMLMLHNSRLSNLPEGQSLYETDLMELAEGLEGRSQNPIPLLVCTNTHICLSPQFVFLMSELRDSWLSRKNISLMILRQFPVFSNIKSFVDWGVTPVLLFLLRFNPDCSLPSRHSRTPRSFIFDLRVTILLFLVSKLASTLAVCHFLHDDDRL